MTSIIKDREFDQRLLAALVVSKVYYCLGESNDSLSYHLVLNLYLPFQRIQIMLMLF